jgi:putative FmdB family regulatory protein
MPTYEYECSQGCRFELQQSIKDDALEKCTRELCPKGKGGVKVRRLISAAGFILKGGGWYADGYGSSKSKSGTGSEGASGSGSESSGSSSSGDSGSTSKSSGKSSSDSGGSSSKD